MGRPKTPTRIHVIRGTAKPCRMNPSEPDPRPEVPPCPEYLAGPALVEWDRVTKEMEDNGMISLLDMAAVAMYCWYWGRMVELAEEMQKDPRKLVKTEKGNVINHPLIGQWKKAAGELRKWAGELGLTPSSRPAVNGRKRVDDDTPFAKMERYRK